MNPRATAGTRRGFTLLELMVTMAIISVVLTATASISGHALMVQRGARARLESQRAANALFGQLRHDLAERVQRADTPLRFTRKSGNDELTLITKRYGFAVQSDSADRRVSIASFRVRDHQLERAAAGFEFGDDPALRPDLATGTLALINIPPDGPEAPADEAFQTLTAGVFRLEFSFLLSSADKPISATRPADPDQIDAVVVTAASLDPSRRRMLDKEQLDRLAEQFRDAEDGQLPAARWSESTASLTSTLPGFPLDPLQNVRIHQSIFPLRSK